MVKKKLTEKELIWMKDKINELRCCGLSQETRDEVVSKIDAELNKL